MLNQYLFEILGDTYFDELGQEQAVFVDVLVDEKGDTIVSNEVYTCNKKLIGYSMNDEGYTDLIINKIDNIRILPTKIME